MKISHRSIAPAATVVAALALACSDSTTGPAKDRFAIAVGDSVAGSYAPGDTTIYRISLRSGESVALHFWALDDPLAATLIDSTGKVYTVSRASSLGGPFGQWTPITIGRAGTYRIQVGLITGSRGGRFALRPVEVPATPEAVAATFQAGDTVSGESLDQPDDVDDFTIDLAAGQRVEIYFQTLEPSSAQPEALFAADSAGVGVQLAAAIAPATSAEDLESRAVALTIARSGRYHLRVQNAYVVPTGDYTGPYRFMVYAIDPRPERAAAAIVPGDTIVESIDHVGDVDTFTLSAPAGKQFNLFAASDGAAPHAVGAAVYGDDSATAGARALVSAPLGAPLLDQASGRFTMPASGTMRVVVNDARNTGGVYRGPYRLLAYPIDSAPESGPATFTPSATPVAGAIDQLGDVDVYHFTLDSIAQIAVRVNWPFGYGSPLRYGVYSEANPNASLDFSAMAAGTYQVRVWPDGNGQSGTFRGPYQFVVAQLRPSPETVAGTLAVGDSITTETLAWPADVDTLHVAAPNADTVVFELRRPAGDTGWDRSIWVSDPATGRQISLLSIWSGDRYQVPRLDLAPGKPLRVNVAGSTGAWAPGSAAGYTLVARRVSAAPEHRSPIIGIGDTVRDSLDYYGDIDDYVVSGTPGQEVTVQGSWPLSSAPPNFVVALIDPATDSVLTSSSTLGRAFAPVIRIPASGQLRVRACVGDSSCAVPTCDGWQCSTGVYPLLAYWLVVRAVDRAPETIAPTFAFGDTVSGERIDWIDDIDEFTFSGTKGQTVNVAFQWMETVVPPSYAPGLQLELVDAGTGTVLSTLVANGTAAALDDVSSGPIVLPSTGAYILSVRGTPDTSGYGLWSTGPFRFRVTTTP